MSPNPAIPPTTPPAIAAASLFVPAGGFVAVGAGSVAVTVTGATELELLDVLVVVALVSPPLGDVMAALSVLKVACQFDSQLYMCRGEGSALDRYRVTV